MNTENMNATNELEYLKNIACKAIDEAQDDLFKLTQVLWTNPELAFQEKYAHQVLTQFLENKGFNVERSYLLDTAYRCVYGEVDAGPNVAVISEYDALPEIGHACGHNLIAEAGVAAAVGIKAAMDAATDKRGKLTVFGTPAEEDGNGKIKLIQKGAFEGVDAAMMVHPYPANKVHVDDWLSLHHIIITYEGRASHAAIVPWEGVNALDAAVTCYQTISNLRQQMKPSWRVHGVINSGGTRPSVIPEKAVLEYYLRTHNRNDMNILQEKILACATAAATSTGCKIEYEIVPNNSTENILSNKRFAEAFQRNAALLGVDYSKPPAIEVSGASSDMGNVSHVVPSIHPLYDIGGVLNHTRAFTKAAGTKQAHLETLTQAKAMAMTAIDIFYNETMLKEMKTEFAEGIAAGM